jgi:hypothetical protein
MLIDSPFTKLMQSQDNLDHVGFDYSGDDAVLSRVMSRQIYNVNSKMQGFLLRLNKVVYEMIENVKIIKTFANPALDKNERRII